MLTLCMDLKAKIRAKMQEIENEKEIAKMEMMSQAIWQCQAVKISWNLLTLQVVSNESRKFKRFEENRKNIDRSPRNFPKCGLCPQSNQLFKLL